MVTSWALLHDSGILGPHDVREKHGKGQAELALLPCLCVRQLRGSICFQIPDPTRCALSQSRVQTGLLGSNFIKSFGAAHGCWPVASAQFSHAQCYFHAGRSAACCTAGKTRNAVDAVMSQPELYAAHLTDWSSLQEEEGDVGDVDHFILNEGESLQVNPEWLQYLQVTHLVFETAASKNAHYADLFSLHEENKFSAGQRQVAAAHPGEIALTYLRICSCRSACGARMGVSGRLSLRKTPTTLASAWSMSLAASQPFSRMHVSAPGAALVSKFRLFCLM